MINKLNVPQKVKFFSKSVFDRSGATNKQLSYGYWKSGTEHHTYLEDWEVGGKVGQDDLVWFLCCSVLVWNSGLQYAFRKNIFQPGWRYVEDTEK